MVGTIPTRGTDTCCSYGYRKSEAALCVILGMICFCASAQGQEVDAAYSLLGVTVAVRRVRCGEIVHLHKWLGRIATPMRTLALSGGILGLEFGFLLYFDALAMFCRTATERRSGVSLRI
jgi:hypothetical protein